MAHALIIGGTRGLGRDAMRTLAGRGDRVSIIGRREPPQADREINNVGHWIADVTESDSVLAAAKSAMAAGGPLNYPVVSQRYRGKDDDWTGEPT